MASGSHSVCLCAIITLHAALNLVTSTTNIHDKMMKNDPSLHPGHLEPLGSRQPRTEIETLTEFPSPVEFFEKYVDGSRPFLLKGGAKKSQAFTLWTDEYFLSYPESAKYTVQVEPHLKEVRTAEPMQMSFAEFVQRYHKEPIYMVHDLPLYFRKDVLMPSPLRCNETHDYMLDCLTWMSAGGTKSVLHYDTLDNINCLFRGRKELLFIDYNKFSDMVPIDRPKGAYSSLDVDRVDFTRYPKMRHVEYVHCLMEEGDCLFIPYRWYHQVNSVANENNMNVAVNIWFVHKEGLRPQQCEIDAAEATLDKFKFVTMEGYIAQQQAAGNTSDSYSEDQEFPITATYEYLLTRTKFRRANFKTFVSLLKKVYPGVFVERSLANVPDSDVLTKMIFQLFQILNVVDDQYVDAADFDLIKSSVDIQKSTEELLVNFTEEIASYLQTDVDDNFDAVDMSRLDPQDVSRPSLQDGPTQPNVPPSETDSHEGRVNDDQAAAPREDL